MSNAVVSQEQPDIPTAVQPARLVRVEDQRAAERNLVWIRDIRITTDKGESHPAKLIDVSNTGCLIRSDHGYAQGEIIWIHIQGSAACPVAVRWSAGGQAGCMFAPGFDTSAFRRVGLPQF